jgi:hypothetical protein
VTGGDPAAVLKADLRRLAFAEEEYFGAYRRYDTSLERIGFQPSPGVVLDIAADATGWMAVATSVDDAAQCVLRWGPLSPGIVRPENRVGESAMGVLACVPDGPPVPPLVQLERDLSTAHLSSMTAWATHWGGSATDSLLRAAHQDAGMDLVSRWFAAAQAYDTVWSAVSDYDQILERGLVLVQGAPWQSLLGAVVEANIAMRAAEQDLIRAIDQFQAAPALTRYRSGTGVIAASRDDLRRDAELMLWIGGLDAAWRAWQSQFFARWQVVDRFLRR